MFYRILVVKSGKFSDKQSGKYLKDLWRNWVGSDKDYKS